MPSEKLSDLAAAALSDGDRVYIEDGSTSKSALLSALRTFLVGTGFHQLNITTLREIVSDDIDVDANHGGLLTSDSTPSLQRVSGATDKALYVEWAAGNVDEVQFDPFMMPPTLDEGVDLTIHLLAKMNAGGDVPTIDVQVFDAIGDTEMGDVTAALSSTLAELVVTIANANISGNPLGFLNISLIPGTHATQLVELYGAWIEWPRKAPA